MAGGGRDAGRGAAAGARASGPGTPAATPAVPTPPPPASGARAAPPPRVDALVDVQLLIERPKTALLHILKLLPGWETANEDDLSVEQFSGAMTNMVYRCGLQAGGREAQVVLMRVHASASDLFDRAAEIATFRGVSLAGLGPQLLLLFRNGRVEEFLCQHVTLGAADIQDPGVSDAIAATLATFHRRLSKSLAASKHHQGGVQLWSRLRAWLDLAQQVAPPAELQQLGMSGLGPEIAQLEDLLMAQHPCWIALCHNDLQYGNIMALQPLPAAAAAADGAGGLAQQLGGLALGGGGQPGRAAQQQQLHGQPPRCNSSESLGSDITGASVASLAGDSTAPSLSGYSAASAPAGFSGARGGAAAGGRSGTGSGAGAPSASAAASTGNLHLLGRSPGRTVQLPDGSLVLPGMRARPRGQSPEPARGKRPDPSGGSFGGSGTGASRLGSRSGAGGRAGEASHAHGGHAPQPPSAAAVLRHAASGDGDFLLLPHLADSRSGGGGAAAEAAAVQRRRRRISQAAGVAGADSSGLEDSDASSSSDSAADSDAADDLLMPALLGASRQRSRGGGGGSGSAARNGRAAAPAASAGRSDPLAADASPLASAGSVRAFRQLRAARRTPAAGLEFPTLLGSDSGSGGVSSDEDYGAGDDSSGLGSDDDGTGPCSIGASSSGRSGGGRSSSRSRSGAAPAQLARGRSRQRDDAAAPAPAGRAAPAPARPAAGPRDGGSRAEAGASADGAASLDGEAAEAPGALTFIDYEYSGFNPIAFDIANHWCEWAADYHTDQPHVLNFSKLPDEAQQAGFVEAYLRALLGRLGVALPADAAVAAAAADGSSSGGGLGLAAVPGADAVGSSARSEAAWSVASSRGDTVASLPETDASYDAASVSSLALSSRSDKLASPLPLSERQPQPDGRAAAPAAGAGGAASGELRDVWRWLAAATGAPAATTGGVAQPAGLDGAAWRRLAAGLLAASRAYMAASHLQWALWGVIQAHVSDVDFDFAGYGAQRWQQYLATRPPGLRGPAA